MRALRWRTSGLHEPQTLTWLCTCAGAAVGSLKVARNKIQDLPAQGVADLPRLSLLDASYNALERWPLPATRAALPRLRSLNLSFNRALPALPPAAFAACSAGLRELNLSGAACILDTPGRAVQGDVCTRRGFAPDRWLLESCHPQTCCLCTILCSFGRCT